MNEVGSLLPVQNPQMKSVIFVQEETGGSVVAALNGMKRNAVLIQRHLEK